MSQSEKDLLNKIRDGIRAIKTNQAAQEQESKKVEETLEESVKPIPLRSFEDILREAKEKDESKKE